jgi:hypothetical protein
MRRALSYLVPLVVAGAVFGGYFAFRTPPQSNSENGTSEHSKLVVLVAFDQMRGDYLSRWAELYGPDGFERMKKGGIWFSDCQIPYACTVTGSGHASLSTGAPPSVHGIVGNDWYDPIKHKFTYCCEPSRFYDRIPPLPEEPKPGAKPPRGAENGISPEQLRAQTVGDSLLAATQNKGRVFSLSLKDRTAVLMGGQKPNGAYCFDTRDGKFHTGAYYGRDAEHPWVAAFNKSKLVDSWFDQKWEKLRSDIDYVKYSGPDDALGEDIGSNGQGTTFPHAYKGKLDKPTDRYYRAVENSPAGNELLFALVKKCVTEEKLGRGPAQDLLCVSFSSNDVVGHQYGPDSQEVLDITLRSDKLIAELLQFLDAEVGKDRYVIVISADHGVCPMPEHPNTKPKYPAAKRVDFRDVSAGLEEALDTAFGKQGDAKMKWFEAIGGKASPWVYLDHRAIEARKLKVDDVAAYIRDWFAGRRDIETAFTRKELEDNTGPDRPFKQAAMLAYYPDRCGDVIVIPKAGVLISYPLGSTHGSPHPYDTHIPFLVYGAGVPALGQRTEQVSSLTIAPTLAWALGVPAPKEAALPLPEAISVKK